MRPAEDIDKLIKKLRYKASAETHDRVLGNVLRALEKKEKQKSGATAPNIWRTIVKSPITKIAAAVVVMVIAVLVVLGPFFGANVTFADVVEQIRNFRPYSCTVTVQDEGPPDRSRNVMHLSLTQRREILSNGTIRVFDLAVPKVLTLVPEKKYALEKMLDAEPTDNFDLLRLVRGMQDSPSGEGAVHEIGVQKIEGRVAKGFHSSSKFKDITVWADVQTKLPVRVEIIHVGKGRKIINSEFKFDVEFDESLFSTTAPEGYTVEKVEKGELTELQKFMQGTTEDDLIEGLRAVATFLGGEFPPEIELRKLQTALKEYIKQNNLSESEAEDRLKPVSEKWTKAHWYTQRLRGELKVHNFSYIGEGVKLGDTNTPVVWWQTEGSETYRVIYADLSVEDLAPENLPK